MNVFELFGLLFLGLVFIFVLTLLLAIYNFIMSFFED